MNTIDSFQGMGPTITNLMGNQVDLAFLPIALFGKLRRLAQSIKLEAT